MSVLWLQGHVKQITLLPREMLEDLFTRIKPIVKKDGKLFTIEDVDISKVAFTWSPVLKDPVADLYEVARIETYHRCGYIALFKPSIDEVLSQIPKHLLRVVTHFETDAGDSVACFSQGDGHRTLTKLYSPHHPGSEKWFELTAKPYYPRKETA